MKFINKILPLLPFLFVFIFSLYIPTDPDLGWHLKYGEYFFQHGSILRDNIFSSMMPNYHWANTSWLTDILTYAVYHLGGFFGISLLGSFIVALTFYFFSKVAKLQTWDQLFLFPLILYLVQPLNAVSFRGQQVSMLFIGMLFYVLSFYPQKKKVMYLSIPLFLLWANLHGQFILGLGLFAIWIILFIAQHTILSTRDSKKNILIALGNGLKQAQTAIIIFVVSLLATFINPFGWGIHTAAISHVGSPLLQYIAEYLPFEILSVPWWNQVIAGLLLFVCFVALFFGDKVRQNLPLLGSGLALFILSFGVRRYAWPAYYLILPLLTPLSAYLKPDNKKLTNILSTVFLLILIAIALVSKYPFTNFTNYNWQSYCKETKCSPFAADYLVERKLTDNVYTLYGWGGWLIWNYPQLKPSIDGRMHLWHENGYSAFEDYYAVEQNNKDIDQTKYNTVLISPDKPVYERLIKLENAGKWKMIYNDPNASIFVRVN